MLEKYGVPTYEEEMVKHLLDQIMSSKKSLRHKSTFVVHHTRPHLENHPLTCLQWFQDSIHFPTLRQAASESVVFMLLAVDTVASEEVDVSME